MKSKFAAIGLALLCAALLSVPAFAAEEEPQAEPQAAVQIMESQVEIPEPPEPLIDDGIFQNGATSGPQTIPGQTDLFEESWEQPMYDALLAGWQNFETTVDLSGCEIYYPYPETEENKSQFWSAFNNVKSRVINDHPELFYADTYQFPEKWYGEFDEERGWKIPTLHLIYREFDGITPQEANVQFKAEVEKALAQVDGVTDRLEQLLILHDYLVSICNYNPERAADEPAPTKLIYRAYGAFVLHDAVCNGYTLAFQVLLDRLGIPNAYLITTDGSHAWNLVELDNEWYHIDATWDDGAEGYCKHKYFLLSDETSRTLHARYDWSDELPKANSTKYESGWIFNDDNSRMSIYRYRGKYYYVKLERNDNGNLTRDKVFAADSLKYDAAASGVNPDRLDRDLRLNINYGGVWKDGRLYYISWDHEGADNQRAVMALDLDTGKIGLIGQFAGPSEGSIGLRDEGDCLAVSAPNYRTVLTRFSIPPLATVTTGIQRYDNGQSAVVQANPNAGQTIWIAHYNSTGRMTGAEQAALKLGSVKLDFRAVPLTPVNGGTENVFLLDANYAPAIPSAGRQ